MQRLADQLVLSPSDLTDHLACEHLTELKRRVLAGELERPHRHDPHAEIVRRRGDEHERRHLARYGDGLVVVARERGLDALRAAAARTAEAMRAGARAIAQATFFDGRWSGHADVLERRDADGGWTYDVVDTKLARGAKPEHVLQLAAYAAQVERLQGAPPERLHLELGDGTRWSVAAAEVAALQRRVARRLERVVAGPPRATYPEPCAHCAICDFLPLCARRRREDDHLSLVAGARRDQREKLVAAGLPTVRALGSAPPDHPAGGLHPQAFATLRGQAELQLRSRAEGQLVRRDRPPEPGRGYARLPPPDPGDVIFDLEGDPYVHGGLEYLWGWEHDGAYTAAWAHDRQAEKACFERFVDLVVERRRRHPGLHVYHYAAHEAATLRRLATFHATREDEVDGLLRAGVLVDLYAVLRQAMQVGAESYSLKAIEPLYMPPRDTAIQEAGGSIVAYERWLETGDGAILDEIAAYNRDDVRSTRLLRDWLGDCRAQAEAAGATFVAAPPEDERPEPDWWPEHAARVARLAAGDHAERRALALLLDFHRREGKPQWWRHFDLRARTVQELVDEPDAIGGLEPDPGAPVELVKRSRGRWLRFPPQEHRLDEGDAIDPETGEVAGRIARFDVVGSRLLLVRGPSRERAPLPRALIGPRPLATRVQREALAALADAVLAGTEEGVEPARSILRRDRPRVRGGPLPAGELGEREIVDAVCRLERSHLVVQGPPGTGKTWAGGRAVVELLRRGQRIAVAGPSHKAIHNLLAEVEAVAATRGVAVRGLHKASDAGSCFASAEGLVGSTTHNAPTEDPALNLVSGTSWLFARPAHRQAFDLLVVDEAGQVALADALAMAGCARSVLLLGDPQQLPQVSQAAHPPGAGASVLEHLLDGRATVPPDRGLFLARSFRMHPEVCAFVSEVAYEGRLQAAPGCERRRVDARGALRGAGLRLLPVEHAGNAQASPEEAAAVAAACAELLDGGRVVEPDGRDRPLGVGDILVVAPYNLAVRELLRAVPDGVRVGTVDRFQGQEAPVVFYAMASSTGEDVPRGLEFLFSRHRLNVAVSRAQCLAVLVASPRLLDAAPRCVEHLALLNATSRFVERAGGPDYHRSA